MGLGDERGVVALEEGMCQVGRYVISQAWGGGECWMPEYRTGCFELQSMEARDRVERPCFRGVEVRTHRGERMRASIRRRRSSIEGSVPEFRFCHYIHDIQGRCVHGNSPCSPQSIMPFHPTQSSVLFFIAPPRHPIYNAPFPLPGSRVSRRRKNAAEQMKRED